DTRGLAIVGGTLPGFGAYPRLDRGFDGACIGALLQPALLAQRRRILACLLMATNRSLAMRPEIVPSAIRSRSLPRWAALTGDWAIGTPRRFSMAKKSPITQLAACLASRPLRTDPKNSAGPFPPTSTPAAEGETPASCA